MSSGGTRGEPTKEARGRRPLVRGLGQSPRMEDSAFPVSLFPPPPTARRKRKRETPSFFLIAPPSNYVTVLMITAEIKPKLTLGLKLPRVETQKPATRMMLVLMIG